jgi:hypothetical protein
MAKISQLPLVEAPDGHEQVIVLKDGIAQRTEMTGLLSSAAQSITDQVTAMLTGLEAVIGADVSDVTSASVGTLLGGGNPTNNDRIQLSAPVAHAGFTTRVEWSMSAPGTGAIYACELLSDGTYKVVYARTVTSVAGANSADISDGPFISAQARWGYKRFGGGSVLYQATAGAISPYLDASAVAAVGDIAPVAGTSPVTIGMQITQLYAPAPLSDRIAKPRRKLHQHRMHCPPPCWRPIRWPRPWAM